MSIPFHVVHGFESLVCSFHSVVRVLTYLWKAHLNKNSSIHLNENGDGLMQISQKKKSNTRKEQKIQQICLPLGTLTTHFKNNNKNYKNHCNIMLCKHEHRPTMANQKHATNKY